MPATQDRILNKTEVPAMCPLLQNLFLWWSLLHDKLSLNLWLQIVSHLICCKTVERYMHSKTTQSLLSDTWGSAGETSQLETQITLLLSWLGTDGMTRDRIWQVALLCCLFWEHMAWGGLASSQLCSLKAHDLLFSHSGRQQSLVSFK